MATAALHTAIGLRTAAATGGGDGAPVTTPRTPAREAAERELSEREYHQDEPGLFQRLLDWVWDHIASLLDSAAHAAPGGWVGLAVVACALLLLVIALRMRLGKLRSSPASGSGALFSNRPRSAAEHRTAAEAHAAAGRWSEAVQDRMRAIVRSLEERALLDHRPGRTADEAAAEAGRSLPDHADALKSAARSFDEVTYAERQADAPAYSSIRDLDSALQRAVPQLPEPGFPGDSSALEGRGRSASAVTTPDGGGR